MTEFVTSSDGERLALHELGDAEGPAVLMLHGFSSSTKRNWLDAGWDRALGEAGLRGVAMDLRGHGESAKPPQGSYDVALFMDDVTAAIGYIGTRPLGAIGYSMGARLAWRYASVHADAFDALVVGGLPASDPFQSFDIDAAIAAVRGEGEATDEAAFVVQLATMLPENEPEALVALAAEVAHTAFDPSTGAPAVPTLVMTGDADDRASDSEELLPHLVDGRFVPIPGRNHVNAITSRAFKGETVAFLREHLAR